MAQSLKIVAYNNPFSFSMCVGAWLDANWIFECQRFYESDWVFKRIRQYCMILIGNTAHFWLFV